MWGIQPVASQPGYVICTKSVRAGRATHVPPVRAVLAAPKERRKTARTRFITTRTLGIRHATQDLVVTLCDELGGHRRQPSDFTRQDASAPDVTALGGCLF